MSYKRKTMDTWIVNYDGLNSDNNLIYQGFTTMYKNSQEAYKAALFNNAIASSSGIKIYFYVTYKRVRADDTTILNTILDSAPSKILHKRHGVNFI